MPFFTEFLYPELQGFAPSERTLVLHEASRTPLDALELFGMAAGLVAVTALTRYAGVDLDSNGRFVAALINFLIAFPMLGIALLPFHIRRVRRGLRDEQTRRGTPHTDPRQLPGC